MGPNGDSKSERFLSRFYDCSDGVIRSVRLSFASRKAGSRAVLVISVRDSDEERNEGWVNLHLVIEAVEEFRIAETPNSSNQVLSSGVQIGEFDGLCYFDFSPWSLQPDGPADYRRSEFYIAGRSFQYSVKPYPKSWIAGLGRRLKAIRP